MRHVKQQLKNNENVHFMPSFFHTLCGAKTGGSDVFTRKKVNCAKCIHIVESAKEIKNNEYKLKLGENEGS